MINFKILNRIAADDLEDIINEKQNPFKADLTKLKASILKHYDGFIEIENSNRVSAKNIDPQHKLSFLSLYGSQTKTAKSVIQSLIDALDPKHDSKCLFCGIGEYEEIDHFLPKEHFPQYAIFHKNLIPICGKCNKKKGDHIPGLKRDFLHLVYDQIPIEEYLEVEIQFKVGSTTPIVDFHVCGSVAGLRIEKHIKFLDLISRYNKKGVQYILRIEALCTDFGPNYAQEELGRNLQETSTYFGDNFWKCVLIRKLIQIDYVTQYCS